MRDYPGLFNCLSDDLAWLSDFVGPPGPKEFAATQLLGSFYKKLAPDGTNTQADAAALLKFRSVNASVKSVFSDPPSEFAELVNTFELILERCSNVYQDDLALDLAKISEGLGVGPGMNVGAESQAFYSKVFDSKLTTTSDDLLALYRAAILSSDMWAEAERQRFAAFGRRIVSGNTMFFVPKNREISRTAATEPTVNMLIQKGIGQFLEQSLWRHFRIDLRRQPDKNREMARLGSQFGTLATIDLVSASDMVGLALCERFLTRSGLNAWLVRSRSPETVLPDGSSEKLNMVGTMGNGFSFPLQTLIFASAVKAVYAIEGLPFNADNLTFGVFGDDIVCLTKAYDRLCWLLKWLGFEVNEAKSFSVGPFRESCGFDYYLGHQVRGVYLKTLESVPSVYSAINRLNRWSATHRVQLPKTIEALRLMLPKKVHYVPFQESDDAGWKVPSRCLDRVRLVNGLYSYRALVPRGYRRAVPIDRQGSDALGYRDFNESGWGVTFLGGYAQTVWPMQHLIDENEPVKAEPRSPPLAFMGLRKMGDFDPVDLLDRKSVV